MLTQLGALTYTIVARRPGRPCPACQCVPGKVAPEILAKLDEQRRKLGETYGQRKKQAYALIVAALAQLYDEEMFPASELPRRWFMAMRRSCAPSVFQVLRSKQRRARACDAPPSTAPHGVHDNRGVPQHSLADVWNSTLTLVDEITSIDVAGEEPHMHHMDTSARSKGK